MGYKKHNWIKYGNTLCERTCEIKVKDSDGKIIDRATWSLQDKNSERKIFTVFKHRYGIFKRPKEDSKINLTKKN